MLNFNTFWTLNHKKQRKFNQKETKYIRKTKRERDEAEPYIPHKKGLKCASVPSSVCGRVAGDFQKKSTCIVSLPLCLFVSAERGAEKS